MDNQKQTFILAHPTARALAIGAVKSAPDGYYVEVREATRTLEQNALMWGMLTDVSKQVVWYGQKLTEEEWKDVFTAALKKQKVVPGIDGGFVVCGAKTSRMSKSHMSDLIELMFAFGAEKGVIFHQDSEDVTDANRETMR